MPTHTFRHRRRHRVVRLAVAVLATVTALGISATSSPPVSAETGPSKFPFADPDTVAASTGYVTVGTTRRGINACGQAGSQTWHVPYAFHGSGEFIGLKDQCADGDAMPSGGGSWTQPGHDIWAPSLVKFGGRWILYYTATKAGSVSPSYPDGQKCIGKAEAGSAMGPFTGQTEVACPTSGRWAIDPDGFVDGGNLYMTYRDDNVNSHPQTGISVVQMGTNGHANWATRRTLFSSTDVTWEYAAPTGTYIVENPSMMRINTTGRMYLFFSGNHWQSSLYSTGVADCGTTVTGSIHRCTPLVSANRPYFGWIDNDPPDEDLNPVKGLPQNQRGPGGMSLFRTHGGAARVVWHYIFFDRWAIIGELAHDGTDFTVT